MATCIASAIPGSMAVTVSVAIPVSMLAVSVSLGAVSLRSVTL